MPRGWRRSSPSPGSSCRPMPGWARRWVSCARPSPSRWCAAAICASRLRARHGQCDHRRDAGGGAARWCAPVPASAALIEPRSAFMRYVGQGHEIVVPLPARDLTPEDARPLRETFEGEYRALFSRIIPHGEVEILTWSLTVSTAPERASAAARCRRRRSPHPKRAGGGCSIPSTGGSMEVPVYRRPDLSPGASVEGPRRHRRGRDHHLRHRRLRRRHQCARLHRPGSPRGVGG